jgi:glycine cleavage system H protein
MVKVKDYDLPDDLHYHKQHMWVRVEGELAVVGITDFTCKAAGEITYIELPDTGEEVEAEDLVGSIETGKWMGKLYTPVSGEIVEVNEAAADEPTEINADPYGGGWLFKVRMSDASEVEELMKGQAAVDWLEQEIETHLKK